MAIISKSLDPDISVSSGAGRDARLLAGAVAAYLGRFQGASRAHAASDLGVFLDWCADPGPGPADRPPAHLELYVRWLQETRHYKPSTVSRRVSVLTGFYRTAVIDGVLEASPAEHLRRPTVPPESPTLGLDAPAVRGPAHRRADFTAPRATTPWWPCSACSACGSSKPPASTSATCCEEHGHRVLRVVGKGTKIVLVPLPPAVARAIDQAIAGRGDGPILLNTRGEPDGPARRHPPAAPPRRSSRSPIAANAPTHAQTHSLCLVVVLRWASVLPLACGFGFCTGPCGVSTVSPRDP